jgi:hypothetical protein
MSSIHSDPAFELSSSSDTESTGSEYEDDDDEFDQPKKKKNSTAKNTKSAAKKSTKKNKTPKECQKQISEEMAMSYANEMRLSLTGARVGDVLVGKHNINYKALIRIVHRPVLPCCKDLDAIRAHPAAYSTFLYNLQRIPFFASMSTTQRDIWLKENQSKPFQKDHFLGDDIHPLSSSSSSSASSEANLINQTYVILIQPGESKNASSSSSKANNKKTSGLCDLDDASLELISETPTLPSEIERMCSPNHMTTASHPVLIFIKRLWKLDQSAPFVDPTQFRGFKIHVPTGSISKQTSPPISSSHTSVPEAWFSASIGSEDVALIVPHCIKKTDLSDEAILQFVLECGLMERNKLNKIQLKDMVDRYILSNRGFTSAGYKSELQKLVRFQPHKVQLNQEDLSDQFIPGDIALVVCICLELRGRGSFIPDIQRFVTGLESCTKRIAVVCFEDACPNPAHFDPSELVSLLAAAKLAQSSYVWFPDHDLILKWIRFALIIQASSYAWKWNIPRGADIKSFSLPRLDCNKPSHPLELCSILLDNLKSFKGDLDMVRDVATHHCTSNLDYFVFRCNKENGNVLDYSNTPAQQQLVMPLCHCVDFHWTTDFIFFMDPTVVESIGSDEKPRPFAEIFSTIWQKASSLNPRRAGRYEHTDKLFHRGVQGYTYLSELLESDPFLKQLRDAQWLYLQFKRIKSQQERVAVISSSSSQPRHYPVSYVLDQAWLSALVGPIELKIKPTSGDNNNKQQIILVSLKTTNPDLMVAMRKPSRQKKSGSLDDEITKLAIETAKLKLMQDGVPMNAARAPCESLQDKILFLVRDKQGNENYIISNKRQKKPSVSITKKLKAKARKFSELSLPSEVEEEKKQEHVDGVVWEDVRNVSIQLPIFEPIHPTFANALAYTGKGVVQDFDHQFRHLLEHTPLHHLQRAITFINGYSGQIQMNRISRDGRGLKHAVSIADVGVYQFLMKISLLAPCALRPLVGFNASPVAFRVHCGPLMWSIRDKINQFVALACDNSSSSSSLVDGWSRFNFHDKDNRTIKTYQQRCLDDISYAHLECNRRLHILWLPPGMGKTIVSLLFVKFLAGIGKLPKYVLLSSPKSAISHLIKEIKLLGLDCHPLIMTKSKLKEKKQLFYSESQKENEGEDDEDEDSVLTMKPFAINIVEHDDLRRCKTQIVSMGKQVLFILDECDKTFNDSLRTSAAYDIAQNSLYTLMMSGTMLVDSNLSKLIQWLSICVNCEVTNKNVFSIANSIVANQAELKITIHRNELKDPDELFDLIPGSKEKYKSLVPPSLGGTNRNTNRNSFREAAEFCWDVCDNWIMNSISQLPKSNPHAAIVSRSHDHSKKLSNMIFQKFPNLNQSEVYVLDESNNTYITAASVRLGGIFPRFFIFPMSNNRGFELTAYDSMFSAVYFCNHATTNQSEARLIRLSQEHPAIQIITAHCGLLTSIYNRQQQTRSCEDALADIKRYF